MNSPTKSLDKRIRIWVIAQRWIVLDALSHSLEKKKQFTPVGKTDFDTVLSKPPETVEADVALVYLEPGDPLEVVRVLCENYPKIRIIAVTDPRDLECSVNVLKFGAVGIVQATQGPNSLFEAIRKTHEGETWLNQELITNFLKQGVGPKPSNGVVRHANDTLTPREIEVIAMIAEGLKSKVIAERLSISGATVRHHLSSIYGKLGVDGRLNLMIYAVENGLVRFDQET